MELSSICVIECHCLKQFSPALKAGGGNCGFVAVFQTWDFWIAGGKMKDSEPNNRTNIFRIESI
jgi:hypothetical protein